MSVDECDKEAIDRELRLLAAVRWSLNEYNGSASAQAEVDEQFDELLAERKASSG